MTRAEFDTEFGHLAWAADDPSLSKRPLELSYLWRHHVTKREGHFLHSVEATLSRLLRAGWRLSGLFEPLDRLFQEREQAFRQGRSEPQGLACLEAARILAEIGYPKSTGSARFDAALRLPSGSVAADTKSAEQDGLGRLRSPLDQIADRWAALHGVGPVQVSSNHSGMLLRSDVGKEMPHITAALEAKLASAQRLPVGPIWLSCGDAQTQTTFARPSDSRRLPAYCPGSLFSLNIQLSPTQ